MQQLVNNAHLAVNNAHLVASTAITRSLPPHHTSILSSQVPYVTLSHKSSLMWQLMISPRDRQQPQGVGWGSVLQTDNSPRGWGGDQSSRQTTAPGGGVGISPPDRQQPQGVGWGSVLETDNSPRGWGGDQS